MCVQWECKTERVLRPRMESPDVPSPNTLEKDAGFCSGGDDDDSEESNRSNSDDSGLKMGRVVVPKSLGKNKRKCVEPLKSDYPAPPLKKRIRYDHETDRSEPWDPTVERVPPHPAVTPQLPKEAPAPFQRSEPRPFFSVDALLAKDDQVAPRVAPPLPPPPVPPREQRNYKNMTRERRIEANARERTRVHTISAAFDTLRKSIPAYSHNQKLSKLSVLRIACSYIMALSKVATGDDDDTEDPSLAECVDSVSKTIQTEGKLRKRRDDI